MYDRHAPACPVAKTHFPSREALQQETHRGMLPCSHLPSSLASPDRFAVDHAEPLTPRAAEYLEALMDGSRRRPPLMALLINHARRARYTSVQSALESRLLPAPGERAGGCSSAAHTTKLYFTISHSLPVSAHSCWWQQAARPARPLATAMLPAVLLLAIIITMNVRGPLQTGVFGRHVPHMAS